MFLLLHALRYNFIQHTLTCISIYYYRSKEDSRLKHAIKVQEKLAKANQTRMAKMLEKTQEVF